MELDSLLEDLDCLFEAGPPGGYSPIGRGVVAKRVSAPKPTPGGSAEQKAAKPMSTGSKAASILNKPRVAPTSKAASALKAPGPLGKTPAPNVSPAAPAVAGSGLAKSVPGKPVAAGVSPQVAGKAADPSSAAPAPSPATAPEAPAEPAPAPASPEASAPAKAKSADAAKLRAKTRAAKMSSNRAAKAAPAAPEKGAVPEASKEAPESEASPKEEIPLPSAHDKESAKSQVSDLSAKAFSAHKAAAGDKGHWNVGGRKETLKNLHQVVSQKAKALGMHDLAAKHDAAHQQLGGSAVPEPTTKWGKLQRAVSSGASKVMNPGGGGFVSKMKKKLLGYS